MHAAPLPGAVCSALFIVCSVGHFARDVGLRGSVVLHALLCAWARIDVAAAFDAALVYLCFVHVPLLVMGLLARARTAELAVWAASTVVAVWVKARLVDQAQNFTVTHAVQKLIACHILIERFS